MRRNDGPRTGPLSWIPAFPRVPALGLLLLVAGVSRLDRICLAANPVANPGFEERTPDGRPRSWSLAAMDPASVTCTVTEAGVHAGVGAARLTTAHGEGSAFLEQRVAVKPDTRYTASFRVRVDRGQGLFWLHGTVGKRRWQRRIRLVPDLPRRLVPDFIPPAMATGPHLTQARWTRFRLPFTTAAGQHHLTVALGVYFSRGDIRFDSVELHETASGPPETQSPPEEADSPDICSPAYIGGFPDAPAWPPARVPAPVIRRRGGCYEAAGAGLRLRISPTGFVHEGMAASDRLGPLLALGPSERPVAFEPAGRLAATEGLVSLTRDSRDGALRVRTEVEPLAGRVMWRVRLTNRRASAQRVTLWMSLPAPLTEDRSRMYWDGAWLHKNVAPRERTQWRPRDLAWRFPMTAFWDEHAGWALGLAPDQWVSQLYSSFSATGKGGVQRLGTRLLLAPASSASLTFVSFRFSPRFGFLDAVQRYGAEFPAAFSPTAGVDPRITGAGKYLFSGAATRRLEIEAARRTGTDWQWCYAPYQQQGNIYPKPRFWDPANAVSWALDHHRRKGEPPARIEDWRRAQRARFRGATDAVANMYYVLADTVGRGVMAAYPDSYMTRADGSHYPSPGRWGIRDYVAERAFPYGNSYGRALQDELALVWKDIQPAGFALDEAHEEKRHYGPIQGDTAGLSWDEKGAFMNQAIAFARIMDHVHTLTAPGEVRAAVAANKPHNFLVAFRADGGIIWEGPAHDYAKPFDSPDPWLSCRLLLGHKPASFWKGYSLNSPLNQQVAWDSLDAAQRRTVMRAATEHTLLCAFALGCYPSELQTFGHGRIQDYLPVMQDVFPRGWRPVPAMRSDQRLWLSRFGQRLRTVLVAGNPRPARVQATIDVDTSYIDEGLILFSSINGRAIPCRMTTARTTFGHELPAHELLAARVAARIHRAGTGAPVRGTADTERTSDGRWLLTVRLAADAARPITLDAPLPEPGASVAAVTVNGAPTRFAPHGEYVTVRCAAASTHEIAIRFAPRTAFVPGVAEAARFPLLNDKGRVACKIVIDAHAGEVVRRAARRLGAYAEYYERRRDKPGQQLCFLPGVGNAALVPVLEAGKDADASPRAPDGARGSLIRLQTGEPVPHACITTASDGPTLTVEAATEADLERGVRDLLEVWDCRYVLQHGLTSFSDRFGLRVGAVLAPSPTQRERYRVWFAPRLSRWTRQ